MPSTGQKAMSGSGRPTRSGALPCPSGTRGSSQRQKLLALTPAETMIVTRKYSRRWLLQCAMGTPFVLAEGVSL